jgi:hypothetical protein
MSVYWLALATGGYNVIAGAIALSTEVLVHWVITKTYLTVSFETKQIL